MAPPSIDSAFLLGTVKGAQQLSRALRQFGDKEITKELRKSNRLAAQLVRDEARKRVPVDSGALQGTIRSAGTRTIARIRVGRAKATKTKGVVNYAWLVHRGHVLPGGGRYAGVPYLRDAISDTWDEVLAAYEKGLRDAARRANLKYGTKVSI